MLLPIKIKHSTIETGHDQINTLEIRYKPISTDDGKFIEIFQANFALCFHNNKTPKTARHYGISRTRYSRNVYHVMLPLLPWLYFVWYDMTVKD